MHEVNPKSIPESGISPIDSLARVVNASPEDLIVHEIDGGHMAYGRWIIDTPSGQKLFMKAHRPELFTDSTREAHARAYLEKEQMMFEYLRSKQYPYLPAYSQLIDGQVLVMDAFSPDEEWYWRAVEAPNIDDYICSALEAFDALQSVELPPESHFFPKRIMPVYMEEGWDYINTDTVKEVQNRISSWSEDFHPRTREIAHKLSPLIENFIEQGRSLYTVEQPLYLSHHDGRQANLAFNPQLGARLIDMSWMDLGFKNADSTMLLIDLTKSDYDVSKYLADHFNPDHALLLMGHYLGRSIVPTRDGDPTVRFHQLTSAVTAYELLTKVGYL